MKLSKILAAALAVLLACAPLAGCGKPKMPEKAVVDHVYKVKTLEKPEGMNYARQLFASGDRVYMSYFSYDEEYQNRMLKVYSMNTDGTDLQEDSVPALDLPQSPDENPNLYQNVQSVLPCDDGTLWRVVYISGYDPEAGTSTEEYYLEHVKFDGTVLLSVNADEIWGPPSSDPEERVYHYIDQMTLTDEGVLFMDSGNADATIYHISKEGKVIGKLITEELSTQTGWVQSILNTPEYPVAVFNDYSGSAQKLSLIPLDLENGQTGTPIELTDLDVNGMRNFYAGPGYTFYYTTSDGLFGYDLAANASTKLMDFLNSDITSSAMNRLVILSPEQILTNGYDEVTGEQQLMLCTKVPEEELVPKYILTLAALDMWSVQSEVIRFNRQSDEYRIVVKHYDPEDYRSSSEEYDYMKMVDGAITAMNNDIIAGHIPEILLVNEYVPMDNYISKGIFADLNEYIERDERFSREDFLTNVLDAFSINGKLYEITPSFNVQTLVGKKSHIGDRKGWTMKEFVEWTKTIPEGSVVFYEMTRDQLLELFCVNAYEEFVDPATGTCYFDTEDFKLVLEYVNTLSNESVWDSMDPDMQEEFWNNYENRFRDDLAMLEHLYLNNFRTMPEYMNYNFYTEEPLVMVGLPSMDRSGGVIYADASYAISARSALADGAWEFISMFLTEEYQDDLEYTLPIRLSSLNKMAEEALEEAEEERKRYEQNKEDDQNYSRPAVETTAAAAAKEIVTAEIAVPMLPTDQNEQPMTFLDRAMADEIIAYLKTVNHVRRNNTKVNNIIKEEAAAYFAGQKSLDETAKLIQNRVSILVAESR